MTTPRRSVSMVRSSGSGAIGSELPVADFEVGRLAEEAAARGDPGGGPFDELAEGNARIAEAGVHPARVREERGRRLRPDELGGWQIEQGGEPLGGPANRDALGPGDVEDRRRAGADRERG